jgi:S-adenosylmethionine:tRNA ribosyltransferase-isomerase
MLVCAFCAAGASASGGSGMEFMKKAYQEAIERKYRFYSYGDAMLIL